MIDSDGYPILPGEDRGSGIQIGVFAWGLICVAAWAPVVFAILRAKGIL